MFCGNVLNKQKHCWYQIKITGLPFPYFRDLIDEMMNESDEVWRWLHQKYRMS